MDDLDIHCSEEKAGTKESSPCFLPGSNRRPCPCEGHVITTTLRKPLEAVVNFPGLQSLLSVVMKGYVLTLDAHKELGPMAQRITRLTTDQKIAGSNPAEIGSFSFFSPCIVNFFKCLFQLSCFTLGLDSFW